MPASTAISSSGWAGYSSRAGFRSRAGAAPDLDEVGMGHDVEHAGARGLGERGEVALPDAVRPIAPAPHVLPAGSLEVDGGVVHEVHRADDVVPVATVEQARHPVLPPADVVG